MEDLNFQYEGYLGLGNTQHSSGHPESALAYHRQALDLAERLGQPADQARAHHGLAEAGYELGDTSLARRHWQEALGIFADLGIDGSEETSSAEIRRRLAEIGQDA
jgi:tetratricopeptide (TPR) repeat protein